jgi:hypothetical protein
VLEFVLVVEAAGRAARCCKGRDEDRGCRREAGQLLGPAGRVVREEGGQFGLRGGGGRVRRAARYCVYARDGRICEQGVEDVGALVVVSVLVVGIRGGRVLTTMPVAPINATPAMLRTGCFVFVYIKSSGIQKSVVSVEMQG